MTFGGYLYADLANGRVRLILSHTSEGFYSLISQGNFGGPRGVQGVAGSSSISSSLRFNLWGSEREDLDKGPWHGLRRRESSLTFLDTAL
jgi:hypothetical protein